MLEMVLLCGYSDRIVLPCTEHLQESDESLITSRSINNGVVASERRAVELYPQFQQDRLPDNCKASTKASRLDNGLRTVQCDGADLLTLLETFHRRLRALSCEFVERHRSTPLS